MNYYFSLLGDILLSLTGLKASFVYSFLSSWFNAIYL